MLFELDSQRQVRRFTKDIEKLISALEPRVNNVRVNVGEMESNTLNMTVFYNITNGLSKSRCRIYSN